MAFNNKLIPSIYDLIRWTKLKFSKSDKVYANNLNDNLINNSGLSYEDLKEIQNKFELHLDEITKYAENKSELSYIQKGLNSKQVEERFKARQYNYELRPLTRSEEEIIRANVFTLFNIVNFILAGFVIFASFLNIYNLKNLTFLFVVICNLSIGIFQEIKAKRIVDKLSLLVKSKVLVYREKLVKEIHVNEIVIDDILILQNGDQVPVDAIYLAGESFEVDESMLTGESDSIHKSTSDTVYSGSMVVSGMAILKVDKVATDTAAAKLSQVARSEKKKRSELKHSLYRIIQFVSVIIVPVGLALFLSQYLLGNASLDFTIVTCVAALVGMIPEGLILLTEIAFAVGTSNLSRQSCLVQNMSAIEMLARMDTLCLDKTGTITDGSMKVIDLITLNKNYDRNYCAKVISSIVENTHARGSTQRALAEYFKESQSWIAKDVLNFSSARKWSAVQFTNNHTFYLGAAEFILNKHIFDSIKQEIENWSNRGYRVLLLAESQDNINKDISTDEKINPLSLIIIEDHIREDAPITLNYFAKQNVDIKLISGDNPKTLLAIAKRAGLKNYNSYIDMSKLDENDDLHEISNKYSIFARSNPYQKREILRALQQSSHIVGMTGDGVNDVPALKDADCSIAMVSGSDAARGSADIVLLNDNLSALIQAVYEGRRVINNIERVASLFLIKTIYSSLLSFIYIFILAPYPLIPIQMAVVSSLTIGIPSFFLALKPNRDRVEGKFLEKVLFFSIPPALAVLISILLLQILSLFFNIKQSDISTTSFIILLTIGFVALYKVSRPLNLSKLLLIISLVSVAFFTLTFLGKIVSVANIFSDVLLIILPFVFLSTYIYLFVERIYSSPRFNGFRKKFINFSEKQK